MPTTPKKNQKGFNEKSPALSFALFALALAAHTANAQDTSPFTVSGDLRLRLEQDWDSQTASGAKRQERTRARARARVNAKAELGNGFVVKIERVSNDEDGKRARVDVIYKL